MDFNKFVQPNYSVIKNEFGVGGAPVKMWNRYVRIEDKAQEQLLQVASMPFVRPWVAAMPDTHWGMGATVGSVIPTVGAVIPAAVGVDIGCGMMAVRTNLKLDPWGETQAAAAFRRISEAVPHGRTDNGGLNDIGAWPSDGVPTDIFKIWHDQFEMPYRGLEYSHPDAVSKNALRHLGTLGTGNHFIEVCTEIDNPDSNLWVVIHSGSRGLGNRIGTYFTKLAGDLAKKWHIALPNKDLGYFPAQTLEYDEYLRAVTLAQQFAWSNREIMMDNVLHAIGATADEPFSKFISGTPVNVPVLIHMHHNYASVERINGVNTILTRKGAVDASEGKWVIIPGSMGAKTYIARGLGSKESFRSCSHGAGRAMSRTEALKTFTVADHQKATEGVYCDKTTGVLDETPAAYKDIDAVMESQKDLVEPVLKIKQLVCVKGLSD